MESTLLEIIPPWNTQHWEMLKIIDLKTKQLH